MWRWVIRRKGEWEAQGGAGEEENDGLATNKAVLWVSPPPRVLIPRSAASS